MERRRSAAKTSTGATVAAGAIKILNPNMRQMHMSRRLPLVAIGIDCVQRAACSQFDLILCCQLYSCQRKVPCVHRFNTAVPQCSLILHVGCL